MENDEKLMGQISILRTKAGWQVVSHVGFFECQEDAEAYAVEVLEEHDGERLPVDVVFH